MRVKFTLAAFSLAMALIWIKMARDYSIKVGNKLSNLNSNCKSKWVLK